jgi:hypothetical protein
MATTKKWSDGITGYQKDHEQSERIAIKIYVEILHILMGRGNPKKGSVNELPCGNTKAQQCANLLNPLIRFRQEFYSPKGLTIRIYIGNVL